MKETAEYKRLKELGTGFSTWKRWGPYVSERSWGTVREDYSPQGDAWNHLPHEAARSKAYRWGEDGLAAICDRYQLLVWSLGLWNGKDPILKERLFGLSAAEGNHGEDVKEYYFYLDSTPTHSYMKFLYKYPQGEFPYQRLVAENRARGGQGFEYELLDTGAFHEDRYFDVFVEYAKGTEEDIVISIQVFNRGPEAAPIHLIPQLTFRNTWGWGEVPGAEPVIRPGPSGQGWSSVVASDEGVQLLSNLPFSYTLGNRYLYASDRTEMLFTDNETNMPRVYGPGAQSRKPYVKDGLHRFLINGEPTVNPEQVGTKCGMHARYDVPSGGNITLTLRLTNKQLEKPFADTTKILDSRRKEADQFYAAVYPPKASTDERLVMRQALSGMLWTKQIYLFDVDQWLKGDNPKNPPPASRLNVRNKHWRHLNSMRILSMPDKWEYPWFAAWDLAFHTLPLALVDSDFAKEQLWFLLFEQFQHPNGQIPAYEWEFSDLNPPVQAWAVWRLFNMERLKGFPADRAFLEKCFHKLLINFTWWINKVDSEGNNIFEGGFLGLDNITVLDRSERLPNGVKLEQSDATGWMGFFCLIMMRISLELAKDNPVYESLATKFFQHYVYVGAAMKHMGGRDYSLWDAKDGFFYDVLRYPDGSFHKFRVRSLVGLIPLFAVERLEEAWTQPFSEFKTNLKWFLENRQDLVQRCCYPINRPNDKQGTSEAMHLLAVVDQDQLRSLVERMLDPDEFLSDYGIRSLSKFHESHPFTFGASTVRYEPAESDCKIKGGNSNWRGPVWFPTSFLMIESMRKFGKALGDGFTVRLGGSGGSDATFPQVAEDLANRMIRMFVRGADGRRAIYGGLEKFQHDPHWRDCLQFHEYFHGDNGAGLGATHQTGWTGLVAVLIDEWRQ